MYKGHNDHDNTDFGVFGNILVNRCILIILVTHPSNIPVITALMSAHVDRGPDKVTTLKCLNIGTPKTINFPFVPNGKLMIFRYPIII